MREGNAERGFTLIELMIVVAIIAILAAVVIPNFMRETTKSKRKAEVTAMFAEIGVKQEQFKTENANYMGLTSGTKYVGTTACGSWKSSTAAPCGSTPSTWSCGCFSTADQTTSCPRG